MKKWLMALAFGCMALAPLQAAEAQQLKVGDKVPNFTLRDVEGHTLRWADYRGKAVWLTFMHSQCGPCLQEAPYLQKVQQETARRGGAVIALSMDEDSVENIRRYQKRFKTTYRIAIDQGKKTYGRFGTAIPSSALIDSNGVIRAIHNYFEPAEFEKQKKVFLGLLPRKR